MHEPARTVGILGDTSFVGRPIRLLLEQSGCHVVGISRRNASTMRLDEPIAEWIALCPIWALPEHFGRLEAACGRRLVALSSTSRFTKRQSSDAADREVASRLAAAEDALLAWAGSRNVRATILRPTLIYDGSVDRNITTIAGFIRRFGFFPILGEARGLRQPVHVDDVAAACIAALTAASPQPAYEISGAEVLSYRSMLERVFAAQGVAPRLLSLPGWLIRAAMPLATALPRYRDLSPAMFERMNEDLVFDHAAAARDLGFSPRPFTLPSGQSGKHA
jgi:nucleoside-diphosphate-sugar epimerase